MARLWHAFNSRLRTEVGFPQELSPAGPLPGSFEFLGIRLMRRLLLFVLCVAICPQLRLSTAPAQQKYRRLPVQEFRDKMKAGWIGQMVGAAWGMPIEFQFNGEIVPESRLPEWDPPMINDSLTNDDVFRDTQLLYLLDKLGIDITPRRAMIEQALVWQPPSNQLLAGFYPPGRGVYFSILSGDVIGLVSPGLPNSAISLSEQLAGRMNDGVYAGQWLDGMYAEAIFEKSPRNLIEAGLRVIPENCRMAEAIRDVIRWHQENPNDWQKTWQLIQQKWRGTGGGWTVGGLPAGSPPPGSYVNTMYVVMALLHGEGDLDKSMRICIQSGDDTDSTTPSVGGVLAATLGYSNLPERFKAPIEAQTKLHYLFDNTAWHGDAKGVYTMPEVYEATERVARRVVIKAGGRIEKNAAGEEVFVLSVSDPVPSRIERFESPAPVPTGRAAAAAAPAGERLTSEELAKIRGTGPAARRAFEKWAPGWMLGGNCDLGLAPEIYGKEDILVTYPPDKNSPCKLTKQITIPAGMQTMMQVVLANARGGAFTLVVNVDGQEAFVRHVYNRWSNANEKPWLHAYIDLTRWAGKTVTVELVNKPNPLWNYDWAYWSDILFESRAAGKSGSWKDKPAWLNSTNEARDFQSK